MLIDSSASSNAEVEPTIDTPDIMLQEGASDNSDNAINYESDYTHPPTPEMDMCVLHSELGLTERDWEITYRDNWEPYKAMETPRFSAYQAD